jgi:hypothetical protein
VASSATEYRNGSPPTLYMSTSVPDIGPTVMA